MQGAVGSSIVREGGISRLLPMHQAIRVRVVRTYPTVVVITHATLFLCAAERSRAPDCGVDCQMITDPCRPPRVRPGTTSPSSTDHAPFPDGRGTGRGRTPSTRL